MDHPDQGTEVAVTVDCPPLGRLPVNRRGLRLDGLYVDTGSISLPHQSEVEVTVAIRQEDRLRIYTLHARVMGRSRYGTNLAFQHCRREAYQALRDLVAQDHP